MMYMNEKKYVLRKIIGFAGYSKYLLSNENDHKGVIKMANVWEEINDMVPIYLSEMAEKYGLRFVKIDSIETALVGKNFALTVFIDKFHVIIGYITRDDSEELIVYEIHNYFCEKFDENDRKEIILSDELKEKLINQLIVTNRGLINKWDDVWRGEKDWIQLFKNSGRYYTYKAHKDEFHALNHLIE